MIILRLIKNNTYENVCKFLKPDSLEAGKARGLKAVRGQLQRDKQKNVVLHPFSRYF